MPNYAMVIDQRRCVACMACVVACKGENEVPPGCFRTRVKEMVEGEFPRLRMELRSELCNHCERPPCVYMVHGFSSGSRELHRAYRKGADDQGLITSYAVDPICGGTGMRVNFVKLVKEAQRV